MVNFGFTISHWFGLMVDSTGGHWWPWFFQCIYNEVCLTRACWSRWYPSDSSRRTLYPCRNNRCSAWILPSPLSPQTAVKPWIHGGQTHCEMHPSVSLGDLQVWPRQPRSRHLVHVQEMCEQYCSCAWQKEKKKNTHAGKTTCDNFHTYPVRKLMRVFWKTWVSGWWISVPYQIFPKSVIMRTQRRC